MSNLPEYIDGLPNISGAEKEIEGAIAATAGRSVLLADSRIDFGRIKSAFANALHMHQPLIPAGGRDLRSNPRPPDAVLQHLTRPSSKRHQPDLFERPPNQPSIPSQRRQTTREGRRASGSAIPISRPRKRRQSQRSRRKSTAPQATSCRSSPKSERPFAPSPTPSTRAAFRRLGADAGTQLSVRKRPGAYLIHDCAPQPIPQRVCSTSSTLACRLAG